MEYFDKKDWGNKILLWDSIKKEITFKLDGNNSIIYISGNVANILGFSPDEMMARNILDFIKVEEIQFDFNLECFDNMHILFMHKNGSLVNMEVQMRVIEDDKGKVLSKYGSMIDISKYKEIERSKDHFKIVLESAKDIIYRFEVIPEPKFVYISSAVKEVFGYEVQEYYEDYMHVFYTSHSDDVSILYKKMNNELDYSKPIESRWIHKNGNCVWIEDYVTPVYDKNENLIAFEGVCRDISDRKALEERLRYLTFHDSLTGLKNRASYDKEIKELNNQNNLSVGVIVCDLDNLKVINDTIGHAEGDSIIRSVSKLLLEIKNKNISISRIGGDEFVILVKNTSYIETREICRNINLLVEKYNLTKQGPSIQLSIGYAFTDKSFGKMEEIFKIADKNMYANKLYKHNKIETKFN